MDEHPTPAQPSRGGSVEPVNRQRTREAQQAAPQPKPNERYELRDPFAEVTYRAKALKDVIAKAEELGSTRFTAVGEDGKRTTIEKQDGQWRRGPERPPAPERPLDPGPARGDGPDASNVVRMPSASTTSWAEQKDKQGDKPVSPTQELKAERTALTAELQAALSDRYVIKRAPLRVGNVSLGHTEYRFRGDSSRIAFTESAFKLSTDTNSPSVARSMVDVAQARGWKALRVSGSEDFRRMVWLEAQVRGVKAVGYEPNVGDLEVLKREREARQTNRIEPAHESTAAAAGTPAEKASARGGGGRKAVLSAIEAVLVAKNVPERQRAAVLSAATEKLAQRVRDGQTPQVKVYDKTAPSQRTAQPPTPDQSPTRERAAPAHAR